MIVIFFFPRVEVFWTSCPQTPFIKANLIERLLELNDPVFYFQCTALVWSGSRPRRWWPLYSNCANCIATYLDPRQYRCFSGLTKAKALFAKVQLKRLYWLGQTIETRIHSHGLKWRQAIFVFNFASSALLYDMMWCTLLFPIGHFYIFFFFIALRFGWAAAHNGWNRAVEQFTSRRMRTR